MLKRMHQKRLEMADIRKNEDYKQMTEISQAILGREWE
jgi:hypothetical protein